MAAVNQVNPKMNQELGRLSARLEQIHTANEKSTNTLHNSNKARFAGLDKKLDGLNGTLGTVAVGVRSLRDEVKSGQKTHDKNIAEVERKVRDVEGKVDQVIEMLEHLYHGSQVRGLGYGNGYGNGLFRLYPGPPNHGYQVVGRHGHHHDR